MQRASQHLGRPIPDLARPPRDLTAPVGLGQWVFSTETTVALPQPDTAPSWEAPIRMPSLDSEHQTWHSAGASIGSVMEIELGSNATLQVEGGDTSLSGQLEGKLNVSGGIVRLSGVSGRADIDIAAGSTLYFEGDGDVELQIENSGEIVFGGCMGFQNEIVSSGALTFLDESDVSFESDELHFLAKRLSS